MSAVQFQPVSAEQQHLYFTQFLSIFVTAKKLLMAPIS